MKPENDPTFNFEKDNKHHKQYFQEDNLRGENPVGPCPYSGNSTLDSPIKSNIFTSFALQYASNLVDSGKQIIHYEVDKFISVSTLKYFFAIDMNYVKKKLVILLFPFVNSDWSLKYLKNARLIPKFDLNAPDLYIPLMGYLTYIFVGGLFNGVNTRFSTEFLGVLASQAIALTILEIIIQVLTLFFIKSSSIYFLELVAYSGYKFVNAAFCVILKIIFNSTFDSLIAVYSGGSSSFFVIKSLKLRIMYDLDEYEKDLPQVSMIQNIEYKRKIYFLLITGFSHFFQVWWLSTCLN